MKRSSYALEDSLNALNEVSKASKPGFNVSIYSNNVLKDSYIVLEAGIDVLELRDDASNGSVNVLLHKRLEKNDDTSGK